MKIALDAMNGDYATANRVAGVVLAARIFSVRIALIGKPNLIRTELPIDISIVRSSEIFCLGEIKVAAIGSYGSFATDKSVKWFVRR